MEPVSNDDQAIASRARELFDAHYDAHLRRTDRMFAWLMAGQWVFGVVLALLVSPYGWAGRSTSIHLHVYAAVILGGAISGLPILLAWRMPGRVLTRHVIAACQVLWSALLIHLTGGRIETHFHVFGSLAFLAFYRDWRLLITPTVVVAADHFLRGLLWPESVYGIANPEWWRFLEHAGWVVFEDTVLVIACVLAVREMWVVATRQAEVEALLGQLRTSQQALVRAEKLAALGQLAASVGHELRNPLAAVRNAAAYVGKKADAGDARMKQMLQVMDRELGVCAKIIADLLDFARERPLSRTPVPLRELVDETIGVVQNPAGLPVRNTVPPDLPMPEADRDQLRQVLTNLVQNAIEASQAGGGEIVVSASGGGDAPWRIEVKDQGPGIPPDVAAKVFEPLFTTKTKGTGLGLAICANVIRRHGGAIALDSAPGRGTTFSIELPR